MAILRRGRKPKVQENEEALNFEEESQSAENASGSEGEWENSQADESGEKPRVVVRARAKRAGDENGEEAQGEEASGDFPAAEGARAGNGEVSFNRSPGRPKGRYNSRNPATQSQNGFGANGNSYGGNYSNGGVNGYGNGGNGNGGNGNGNSGGPGAYGNPDLSPAPGMPLSALPKNLPSMPDIYGRPEPRLDQDNGKPRLTIIELIRLNMMDLRDLATSYNISHDDMVALKKQEIVFALLKAHTERGGIIYAYGSLPSKPATRYTVRFAVPKRASVSLPCSGWKRSTMMIPPWHRTASPLTTLPRCTPTKNWTLKLVPRG
jgi:transcription termination factor Rho